MIWKTKDTSKSLSWIFMLMHSSVAIGKMTRTENSVCKATVCTEGKVPYTSSLLGVLYSMLLYISSIDGTKSCPAWKIYNHNVSVKIQSFFQKVVVSTTNNSRCHGFSFYYQALSTPQAHSSSTHPLTKKQKLIKL
jgi:hypothetical protein